MSAVGAEADVSPKGGAVRQGDKGKGREIRTLDDSHTVTAVGVEADVSPIGGAVRQGDEGKGREIRTLEDPHTV